MGNNGFIAGLLKSFFLAEKDVAFSQYNGEQVTDITYQQFLDDILKAAGYFFDRKIKNQHVAIAAPNSYDWLVTFFAITASGNVALLLNQDLPVDTIQWQCEKADASMICGDTFASGLKPENVQCIPFDALKGYAPITVDTVYSSACDETVLMFFTSGTTGKSKVVEITSDNLLYGMKNVAERYAIKEMSRIVVPAPFYHVLGFFGAVESLYFHKTVCLGRGIRYLFMDMAALNPTTLVAVPSVLEGLVKVLKNASTVEKQQKYLGRNLRIICYAGASLNKTAGTFLLDLGLKVIASYGMTEVSGVAAWCFMQREHIGTAGKICKYIQHDFQDGELLLKGPTVMKGYYKDQIETAKLIQDGWLHTGDMGYCDADGCLYLTGRKKNTIILSNGENVSPEEIEEKLRICPQILECLIYADSKGICADVYTENETAAADFVKEYNEGVPLYRQVYKVNYSATPLEKTGSGKIKRKENVYV